MKSHDGGNLLHADFANMYTSLRKKEGRMYNDKEVKMLPAVRKNHVHYKEWKARERSFNRLAVYLKSPRRALNILEVGCGNGWLSAQLSKAINGKVLGTDINIIELEQAKRVFNNMSNLDFKNGDFRDDELLDEKFDVIIFAASLQYFCSLDEIIPEAIKLLNKNGEIHILDTKFYTPGEVKDAAKRTQQYYSDLGYAEMADWYFHHSINSLETFNYKILFDPGSLKNKLFKKQDPFPWIVITL